LIRFFTTDEFEDYVRETLKLTKTPFETQLVTFWKAPNGRYISVPKLESVGHVTYSSFECNAVKALVEQSNDQPPLYGTESDPD